MPDPIRRRVSGRVLPPGWAPPMPFPMTVTYRALGRDPDVLWTTPWIVDDDGQVVHYLACGPAGQLAGHHRAAQMDVRGMPANTSVKVILDVNRDGMAVYGIPRHTAN